MRPSMTTATTRSDRIELRATREEKQLISEAASHEQLDVTRFIMRSVLPVARGVVERTERIVLSERDSKRVLHLLEKPPKPTAVLIAAARRLARAGAVESSGGRKQSVGTTIVRISIAVLRNSTSIFADTRDRITNPAPRRLLWRFQPTRAPACLPITRSVQVQSSLRRSRGR